MTTNICTVCGEPMPETGGYRIMRDDVLTIGVSLMLFDTEGYEGDAIDRRGICGIPCALTLFNDLLQSRMGVERAPHMGPESGGVA